MSGPRPLADGGDLTGRNTSSDSRGHDRQVLVIGADLSALATAAFLEQSGLDPVLTTAPPGRARSPAVILWQPGLELLERIGLRRPVERSGTPLDELHCLTASQSVSVDARSRAALVALSRETLDRLLTDRLTDRVRTTDRSVTNVVPTETGVRVTFDRNVDERFDVVVTASQRLGPRSKPGEDAHRVHSWTFPWPAETPTPDGPTEAWAPDCAAFSVPVADTTVARLVATPDTAPDTPISSAGLEARFDHLFEPPVNPLPDLGQADLQYCQTPSVIPASIQADGVALVGRAVSGSLPGDCLGAALGIEDAWVLADSLAYGPGAIDDALGEYASRRRQRTREILARYGANATPRCGSGELAPVLQRLRAARTIAFGHLFEGSGQTLADDVPYRL